MIVRFDDIFPGDGFQHHGNIYRKVDELMAETDGDRVPFSPSERVGAPVAFPDPRMPTTKSGVRPFGG